MKIIPCGHRVLVKQDPLYEQYSVYKRAREAGLALAGEDPKREQLGVDRGTVMAIGPTAFRDFGGEAWCRVGDRVAFAKHTGKAFAQETEDGETEYWIVFNDEDIIAVLENE